MNFKLTLCLLPLVVSCGAATPEGVDPAITGVNRIESQVDNSEILNIAKESKLPECDDLTEGRIAYVKDVKGFRQCEAGIWVEAELASSQGKDGKDGQTVVGSKGDRGEKGDKGEAGENGSDGADGLQGVAGTQGVAGAQGAQGVAGTNGVDGVTTTVTVQGSEGPTLYDGSGVAIGTVFQWDAAYTSYLVNAPSGLRLRISNLGELRGYSFVYTTADCSGTEYLQIANEQWENMFSTPSGDRVRTGAPVSRAVQSKRFLGGTCQAYVATNRTYSLRALTSAESQDVRAFGAVFVN